MECTQQDDKGGRQEFRPRRKVPAPDRTVRLVCPFLAEVPDEKTQAKVEFHVIRRKTYPAVYSIRYTWEERFITAEEEAEINRDDGARFALAMSLSGHRIRRSLLLGLAYAHAQMEYPEIPVRDF